VNFGLNDSTIDRLQEVFRRYNEVDEVIIYGSRAKGNFRNGSDIDITVKGKGINRKIMSNIWQDIEDLNFPYKVDLSDFDNLNTPNLSAHIERVGKVFYRKS
jgi:predicted nucleotidyltransferase